MSANGGGKELLIGVDSEKDEQAYGPQILPGGNVVLFTLAQGEDWDDAQIVVQLLQTGERKVLVDGGTDARYLPTGHLVFGQQIRLLAVPFDLSSLEVAGSPVPVVEGIRRDLNTFGEPRAGLHLSISQQGSLVYVPAGGVEGKRIPIWVDREGKEESLSVEARRYRWPRISPDGRRLAIAIQESDNSDVGIYDLARETFARLTFHSTYDGRPLWTRDGRRVVFNSIRDGPRNLYWKAADGMGQVEGLTTSPNIQQPWSFSPNGKWLLFQEWLGQGNMDIHILSMEGEHPPQPLLSTQFYEQHEAISPDGRWIAYVSNQTGTQEVYVRPFPKVEDGVWQISTEGGREPVWGPKGRELFYFTIRPRTMIVVPIQTNPAFTPGNPEVLFRASSSRGGGRQYDIHPDGQRFLMLREVEEERNQINVVQNWFEELKRLVPTE